MRDRAQSLTIGIMRATCRALLEARYIECGFDDIHQRRVVEKRRKKIHNDKKPGHAPGDMAVRKQNDIFHYHGVNATSDHTTLD